MLRARVPAVSDVASQVFRLLCDMMGGALLHDKVVYGDDGAWAYSTTLVTPAPTISAYKLLHSRHISTTQQRATNAQMGTV